MSLASDFNRKSGGQKKSEDKRAPRPYHPRTSAVHDWPMSEANHALNMGRVDPAKWSTP
ncbi:hypothetical protein ABEW61_25715 [Paenibacillus amylolyticus]|uniref:hypothetical protein n=1 Tax=Paenibacillus amylolyticus TaxID=1451 RepID=UPI003D2E6098